MLLSEIKCKIAPHEHMQKAERKGKRGSTGVVNTYYGSLFSNYQNQRIATY